MDKKLVGLAAGLTKYRPFFLVMTGVVLAVAFHLAYRKRSVACADGSCELRAGSRAMNCAACTVAIKQSVEKVPGVLSAEIDFPGQRATVVSNGKTDPEAVIQAVATAGYKAELLNGGGHE